ncbi:aminoglycoside phosphotransferase [Marinicauda pacifica]|uniref:Phosphotransferase family protein n=1 Tax=Marinicauda pacifica TaxID=1133559 RepID=A0A4S2HBA5_9PROT|nr:MULTISPECIES: phosphotransferase family protein [Marinicauda]TGY92772.1 phosphotransferase family protein [Marinicauda pacifica]GGE40267.1 aminoglycoside phosphotransferase [Marinicauda pacifica]
MTDLNEQFSGTKTVTDALKFDESALDAWMTAHVGDYAGPLTVTQFKGGQSNPTYKLDTPSASYVLRRKPPGKLLPSAHAVDREFTVMSALGKTGFPVPKMHGLCEDESVIGTPFYVMDFVKGRIFWDPYLPGMEPDERAALYDASNATLAQLHNIDYEAIGLGDYGKPGNYFDRQIGRWTKQYKAAETRPIPAMDKLIEWLPEHAPEQERTSIVHGDYRLDNMMFHPTEPKVIAVLDWELSTLGDPLADFTYQLMQWRTPKDIRNGFLGVDLKSHGIPTEDEYVKAYCERTGRDGIPKLDFYISYNIFRLAGIAQGVYARSLQGNASNERAKDLGALVEPMAEYAWEIAQKV